MLAGYSRPRPDFSRVSGIAFRDGAGTVVRPVSKQTGDMHALPPALEALPLDVYRDLGTPHAGVLPPGTMFAPIQTCRGCQDKRTFCHISPEKFHAEVLGR